MKSLTGLATVLLALSSLAWVSTPAQASIPVNQASAAFGWGKNSGALGDGTTTRSNVPVAVSFGTSSGRFVDTSGAGDHSCGIDDAGAAYCWGNGFRGQLGTGSTANTTVPTAVATTGTLPDTYKDIETGEAFSCGIASDDSVYCWGWNNQGQLGNGNLSVTSSSVPVAVLTGASPGQFIDLAVGGEHVCAIGTDSHAYCWGRGDSGTLGNGTTTRQNPSPLAVLAGASPGVFTSIASGDERTCAIGTDSGAYCWGKGDSGGNGNGANVNANEPVRVSHGASSGLYIDIAPGGGQTCGVSTSGAAYCWGRNNSGQLGTGDNTSTNIPTAVSTSGSLPSIYLSISAGRDFTCGIAQTRTAHCWGANGNGGIGDGIFGGSSNLPIAVSVTGALAGRSLLQIDLGPEFVVAIAGLTGVTATFGVPTPTADGFTVNVTNYDDSSTWLPSVNAGAVTAGTPNGSTLPLTVTGLAPGQSSVVTVATSRTGYLGGTAVVSGAALPTPPPIIPTGPPVGMSATAGDRSAFVTWSPPDIAGTYPVTAYRVTSAPAGGSCVTTALSCRVSGLRNGTAYTFMAMALSGAGWSASSAPSKAVTPAAPVRVSITITGGRSTGVITVSGTTTGFDTGGIVMPWLRFAGDRDFREGTAQIAVDQSGDFTWSRSTRKTVSVYVQTPDGSVTSNRVRIRR